MPLFFFLDLSFISIGLTLLSCAPDLVWTPHPEHDIHTCHHPSCTPTTFLPASLHCTPTQSMTIFFCCTTRLSILCFPLIWKYTYYCIHSIDGGWCPTFTASLHTHATTTAHTLWSYPTKQHLNKPLLLQCGEYFSPSGSTFAVGV